MNQGIKNLSDELLSIEQYCVKEAYKNPKVSVVVPVYNNEKYIYRCLSSLIKQSLKEIEIIIVNDGSTDNTKSVIKKIADIDGRVKLIEQSNKKQGAARNKGTENATGEYVGYVDSDDWVDLDYFEKLYLAAKKYDSDIALATNVRIGNGKTKKRLKLNSESFVTSLQEKIDISNQAKNPCPTNKIYRRTLLQNNSIVWPEGVYCEDKLFTIQTVYYSNGMVTVPETYYYYYRNPNSTVHIKTEKLTKDKNSAKLAVLNFLKEKGAQIRDRDFWATIDEKRFLGITLYRYEESLHTGRVSLFGLKIREFKL